MLDIDGDCPPDLGEETRGRASGPTSAPTTGCSWERIGIVRHPERGEERSEALALSQLLIVSHLVGALDGAFEL